MDTQWWTILVVVAILGAIIAYRQLLGTRAHRDQDRRIDVQAQSQARSPAEEISQREDRRLAGMTVEDRAWEQAALKRQHDSPERLRRAGVLD